MDPTPTSPRILLVNLRDSDISAEIPHLFHRAGFPVDVYCSPHSWFLKSRYWERWHSADTTSFKKFVRGLREVYVQGAYTWVVCTDDSALRAIYDYMEEDLQKALLPVIIPTHTSLASSKIALSQFSEKYNLRTPRFSVHTGQNDISSDAHNIPFPLLLKVDRSGGGSGVFFCKDAASLPAVYETIPVELRSALLIQEYIAGQNIAVEALYCNGILIAHARAQVLQNVGGEFHISCVREYQPHAGLQRELEYIGTALGINGFCSFTFMYDQEKDLHYLVEADLRTHAWFSLSRFVGVDFAEAIKTFIEGTPYTYTQTTGIIRHFSRDVVRALQNRDVLTLAAWVINKDGRWKYMPTHSVRLWVATVLYIARSVLYKVKIVRPVGRIVSQIGKFCFGKTVPPSDTTLEKRSRLLFLEYIRREKKRISLGVCFAVLQAATLLPIPFLIKNGFDAIVSQYSVEALLVSLGWVFGLLILGTVCTLLNRYISLAATKSILAHIRQHALAYLLTRDQAFYVREDLDALHSQIVHDSERIDRVMNRFLTQILPSALIVIGLFAILVYLDPLLSIIITVCVPLLYFFAKRMGRVVKENVQTFHADFSQFSTGVSFVLKYNDLISLSGAMGEEMLRQKDTIRALQESSARMAWFSAVYAALQNNSIVLLGAIILIIGGMQIVNGAITIGAVVSFYIALNLLATHARAVLSSIPSFIEGQQSLQAITPYLEHSSYPETATEQRFEYPLIFSNVSFGYTVRSILKDVSFALPQGSVTGIFGESGSGKTTLIRLLLGLYSPTEGSITAGGTDIHTYHLPSYRRSIGVLPQEPLFFPGTIRENLCFATTCSEEELIEAAKICRIHDTISALPDGYTTQIGHRGVSLSGGEKQRLALVRALLRKPQLLILDEPDNNLSVSLICDILTDLKACGHTIILISHNHMVRGVIDQAFRVEQGSVFKENITTIYGREGLPAPSSVQENVQQS